MKKVFLFTCINGVTDRIMTLIQSEKARKQIPIYIVLTNSVYTNISQSTQFNAISDATRLIILDPISQNDYKDAYQSMSYQELSLFLADSKNSITTI